MIPRLTAVGVIALLVPVLAWATADDVDGQEAPAGCTPVTDPAAATTTTTIAPTSAPPTTIECPGPTTAVPTTSPPPTGEPTTSTLPASTTLPPADPASTSTTTPGGPDSTIFQPSTTTAPPADEATTPITVDPSPTTVPDDPESSPVEQPPTPDSGRTLVATGVTDTGQVRPITFPIAGPVRYGNDFGVCRDGCRRQHKGNDLIGDRLQPLLAMRDGVVDRLLDHPTAGLGVVIRDPDGWEYHTYHVNNDTPGTDDGADDGSWGFAPGIGPGAAVTAGQVIAWMGDSGNSEGSVPHAHVEIHTPDGRAINPYWSLRRAQRDVNCSIAQLDAPAAITPTYPAAAGRGWASIIASVLPGEWTALSLTGGRPGSGVTAARMWIGPAGYVPVDEASLRVGDARLDEDCSRPTTVTPPAAVPAELGAILATIRAMETGGNYTTQISSSTASGAYAFLDSSWGRYGGYRRARDAPPPVQDAKAVELATSILGRNGGDVSTIPVSWYIGHVPIGAEWDTVPSVGANTLTPREYQTRWMATYARILGTPDQWVGTAPTWASIDVAGWCRPVVVDVGRPGTSELALTLTRSYGTDPTGRIGVPADDPCDPTRTVAEPTDITRVAADPVSRLGGPR